MQWVETTARTVEEAKALALDQLGVAEDEAEFEILDEPRPGLFGRVRGEARVRARVRPTQPRQKERRAPRRRGGRDAEAGEGADAAVTAAAARSGDDEASEGREPKPRKAAPKKAGRSASAREAEPASGAEDAKPKSPRGARRPGERKDKEPTVSEPGAGADAPSRDEVAAEAERFLAGLVTAFGLGCSVTRSVDGDEIEIDVDGDDLGLLIGPRGSTLLAIQDVARVASQRRLGDHETRLRIDVAGYRAKRREALTRFANEQADEVIATGTTRVLEAMPSADRKVVHDALAEREGILTLSEGEDPNRRVVISRRDA